LRRNSAGLLIGSGLAVVVVMALFQKSALRVTSEPEAASLWLDGKFVGVAPVEVTGLVRGQHVLVAKKHGYKRWRQTVTVSKPNHEVAAQLDPEPRSSLKVTTSPSGALVLVDGQPQGRTPLTIDGVAVGALRLRLVKRGCAPSEETVVVQAGHQTRIHKRLNSRVAAYYQQKIDDDPCNLHHIIELGHHYVLKHDFRNAAATFRRAAPHLKGDVDPYGPEVRLYRELDNIHESQFDYGDYETVRKGQDMAREVLEAYAAERESLPYVRYYLGRTYRREGQYRKALEQLRRAETLANDSTLLRRIQQEMRQVYR